MRLALCACWGAMLIGSFASLAFGDIPVPGQPFRPRGPVPPAAVEDNSVAMPVVVKHAALKHAEVRDAKTIKAKLIVPRGLLPGGGGAGVPAAGTGAAPAAAPAPAQRSGISPTSTIFAGLALSLAAVSCVFLIRRNKTGRVVALAVLVVAGGLGIWSVAQADLAPGPRPRRPREDGPPRAPETVILIEVAEEGDTVTLILPK